jgi:hypothetical protein
MNEHDEVVATHGAPAAPADAVERTPARDLDGALPLVERLGIELDELRSHVSRNDAEISALHVAAARKTRPWYREAGTIISMLALTLSFGSTYFAQRQAQQRELHDARVELRGLLQRLSELPKENIGLVEQYADPNVRGTISGYIQQENKLLAQHAAELMRRLHEANPAFVTTSEYILVANALHFSYLSVESIAMFEQAVEVIRDATDGVAVYRGLAGVRFAIGDVEGGRRDFERALRIFDEFPTPSAYQRAYTHAFTEMMWASNERVVGNCPEAQTHLARAWAHWEPFNEPGVPNAMTEQLRSTQAFVEGCGTVPLDEVPPWLEQLEGTLGGIIRPPSPSASPVPAPVPPPAQAPVP